MKALHFGAGNIGRGFIGKLLSDAGFEVTFADVNETVVTELQKRNQYDVKVVGENRVIETVKNVTAVNSSTSAVVDCIAVSDIVTTAVGPTVLNIIAKSIAQGIEKRAAANNTSALNIIARCNNAFIYNRYSKFGTNLDVFERKLSYS